MASNERQSAIIDYYSHRSIFLYGFNYLKALQVPFLLCNLFISAELFTLLLLNKPTRFSLCVFALLYDSTHNTVAFAPTLHKNTTGVLPHRPTTVRPAALLLPCLCFHHSVQRLHYHRQLLSAHVCHPCGETLIRFPIKPQKHLCSEENGGCPDGFFKCFRFDYCTESFSHSNPVYNTYACTHAHSYWDPKPHKCSAEQPESSE